METRRLRTLQQPSHIERLLEALVSRANLLRRTVTRFATPQALPPPLQTVIDQAARRDESGVLGEQLRDLPVHVRDVAPPVPRSAACPCCW